LFDSEGNDPARTGRQGVEHNLDRVPGVNRNASFRLI
jgi:hypothetical protein